MGLVTAGLDGYWNSQKGFSGSQWKDLSGKGRDGTVIGGASRSASGLTFNGSDSQIRITLPAMYESPTQPYTVDFWFRFDGTQNGLTLFSASNRKTAPHECFYTADSADATLWHTAYPTAQIRNALRSGLNAPIAHIAITYTGSTYCMYRNGVLLQTVSATLPLLNPGGILIIGGTETTTGLLGYAWKGIIDCFRVYNRQLGATEVSENYKLGMAIGISYELEAITHAKSTVTVRFNDTAELAAEVQSSLNGTAELSLQAILKAPVVTGVVSIVAGLNLANTAAAAAGQSGASAELDVAVGPGVTPVELEASAGGELTASGYFYLAVVADTAAALSVTGFLHTERSLVAAAGSELVTSAHLSGANPFSGTSAASSRASGELAESIWKKIEFTYGRWK